MKRDESIDVQIEISAGWKVVKGFCDELHRKNFAQIFANQSDWVRVHAWVRRVTSFDEPPLHSQAQLLLTTCTNMNIHTCVRLKMYLKITHTHRCTVGIHVPHELKHNESSYADTQRHIQPDWCLGICTDHRWIRNTKYKIRIRRVAGYFAYISTALALRSLSSLLLLLPSPSPSTLMLTFMCHAATKATLTVGCRTKESWQRGLVSGDTWLRENCVRITAWKTEFITH